MLNTSLDFQVTKIRAKALILVKNRVKVVSVLVY